MTSLLPKLRNDDCLPLVACSSGLKPPATSLGRGRLSLQDLLLRQNNACFRTVETFGIHQFPKSPIIPGKVAFDKKVTVGSLKVARFCEKVAKLATLITSLTRCFALFLILCSKSWDQIEKLNSSCGLLSKLLSHNSHSHKKCASVCLCIVFFMSFLYLSGSVQAVKAFLK